MKLGWRARASRGPRSPGPALGLLLSRAVAVACALAAGAAPARAQGFGGLLNPTTRAAGTGGASTAVFWSDDRNDWANPALLGYGSGLYYRWNRTRIPVGLQDVVTVHSQRIGYSGGGLGIESDRLKFDYGPMPLTDGGGFQYGVIHPTEEANGFRFGLSVSRVLRTAAAWRGRDAPAFTRYADIAFGFGEETLDIDILPGFIPRTSTRTRDVGVLVIVSPLIETEAGGAFLDLAYGFADLNYNDAAVIYIDEDEARIVPQQRRHGTAVRFGIAPSPARAIMLENRFGRLIGSGMYPLLSVSVAADFTRHNAQVPDDWGEQAAGLEVQLVNMLALRGAYLRDVGREIEGASWGFGVGIPFGAYGSMRYDFAHTPWWDAGSPRRYHGFSLNFDPVAIARR